MDDERTVIGVDVSENGDVSAAVTMTYDLDGVATVTNVEWGAATAPKSYGAFTLPPGVTATSGKSHVIRGKFKANGTWTIDPPDHEYHYGDVVTVKGSGDRLMVLRRVSGFAMNRPDQWECLVLDPSPDRFDPDPLIGHWKPEEIE